MSTEDRKKQRLLRRYIHLVKMSEKRSSNCKIYCEIQEAVNNLDVDALANIISGQSNFNINDEDILWFAKEVKKSLPEEEQGQMIALIAATEYKVANCDSKEPVSDAVIKIKRAHHTLEPDQLEEGELAYSFKSSSLFIGDANGVPVKIVDNNDNEVEPEGLSEIGPARAGTYNSARIGLTILDN